MLRDVGGLEVSLSTPANGTVGDRGTRQVRFLTPVLRVSTVANLCLPKTVELEEVAWARKLDKH